MSKCLWCSAPLPEGRKYCNEMHGDLYRRTGRARLHAKTGTPKSIRTCSVEGCTAPVRCSGLCTSHYRRQERYGSVDFVPTVGTHNMTNSLEYRSWLAMKTRCYNPNRKQYVNYGGRGIKVCDQWINSFETFYEDMGPRPSLEYSLERIDVNGNYEPSNCKWATPLEQAGNQRRRYNNTTGFRGVSLGPWGSYVATIRHASKQYHLGSFKDPEEAAYVYDQFAVAFRGSRTHLNVLNAVGDAS